MEIELNQDSDLGYHDSGGGMRELRARITIDENLKPRQKRYIVIYETLGCLLGFTITRDCREEITTKLVDVLDQLEPL